MTFNNRGESTKSYSWGREHVDPLHDVTVVPMREEIQVDYDAGQQTTVELHDGSRVLLQKLSRDYDPTSRAGALALLEEARAKQLLITGLIYFNEQQPPLPEVQNLVESPLALLPAEALRPSRESLEAILNENR